MSKERLILLSDCHTATDEDSSDFDNSTGYILSRCRTQNNSDAVHGTNIFHVSKKKMKKKLFLSKSKYEVKSK